MRSQPPATDAVRVAVALALGREVESPATADWRRVHAVARAERLAALAWWRAGEQIRRFAPPEVVGRWRAESVAAAELADRQRQALLRIADAAARAGERPLVLKGLPLADRLYGDAAVRVSCDIDLFVSAHQRAAAHTMLTALGWEHWYGSAPYDASYRLPGEGSALFLEIHSLLASEALVHCGLVPATERLWSDGSLCVRTLDGPVLPVYLAANLAKHATPPLMSYVDLATVWSQLSPEDREGAFRMAARSRLGRCLRWALARAAALPSAAEGDPAAFRMLGFDGELRVSMHPLLRLMLLSDRPMDAARVLGTWTWPRSLRGSGEEVMHFWGRRMRRSFAGRFRYTRAYTTDATFGD
jgi:hypothetical protein